MKSERRALLLLVAATAVSLIWLVDPYFESMWDAVLYVLTTRSLLAGEGYAVYGEAFHLRPPGFSVLLAPVMAVFDGDFLALNVFTSLLGILALALVFEYFRPRLGIAVTFALCAALWINPQYQSLCNTTLSDTTGLAAVMGCLLVDRWVRAAPSLRREAVLGLAIGCAAYLRTVSLLLVPAIALARVLGRRSEAAPLPLRARLVRILGLILVPVAAQLPWTVWKSANPQPAPSEQYGIYSYRTAQWHEDPTDPSSPRLPWTEVVGRVPTRIEQCVTSLGSRLPKATLHGLLMPEDIQEVRERNRRPFGYALGWIGLACLAASVLRRRDAGGFFALGNLAVLLVYFDFDDRILLPTYVFALAAFLEVLVAALSRLLPARRAGFAAVALLAVMGISDAFPPNDRSFVAERNRLHTAVAAWVDGAYPPDVVVGASLGHELAVFFERPIWFFEVSTSRRRRRGTWEVHGKRGVEVFIHTGVENDYIDHYLQFLLRYARPVHQIESVRIYEFETSAD